MAEDFLNGLYWTHDEDLKGKLLFSKAFQVHEPENIQQLIPKSISCAENCLYCSSIEYCKACINGMLLKKGVCVSNAFETYYFQDLAEREYKPIPANTFRIARSWANGCTSGSKEDLDKCTPGTTVSNIESTFCIRNSAQYDNDCYKECPEGMGVGEPSEQQWKCIPCSVTNCAKCSGNSCIECIKGYALYDSQNCKTSVCGNGVLEYGEDCDDGNLEPGDGCSPSCEIEKDFECFNVNEYLPSVCVPMCRDEDFYRLRGKECDDGNEIAGDGCSPECKIEPGWWCINSSPTHLSECFCHPRYLQDLSSFSDDYMILYLRFSADIELKGAYDNLCLSLFGSGSKLFGEGHKCEIDKNAIIIYLGDLNEVYQDTILSINEGFIGAYGCSSSTFSGDVIVPEIKEQEVTGIIKIEDEIAWCEKAILRITNIAGGLHRPYKKVSILFEVFSGSNNIDNQEALAWKMLELQAIDHFTYYIVFPEGYFLPSTTYDLSLNIVNFQGIVSNPVRRTVRIKKDYLVRISIEGLKDGIIDTTEDLIIRSVLTITTCDGSLRNVSDIESIYSSLYFTIITIIVTLIWILVG